MDVNLEPIATLNLSETERRLFNSIQTSLQSPLNPEPRAQKIAGDIQLLCDEANSQADLSAILGDLWAVLVELAYLLPPDHPWQDILVGAVETLRAQDGEVKSGYKILWKDLPGLSICLNDNWQDPTTDPDAKPSQKEIDKWINLNSFATRLTSKDFAPWLQFPIWELRIALEAPPLKGATMNCRLYVASEWIIRCGDVVILDMCSNEKLKESLALALQTGPLCLDTPPLSMKRWGFWKRRFLEICANRKTLELDDAISGRIIDTLYSMMIAEEQIAVSLTCHHLTF